MQKVILVEDDFAVGQKYESAFKVRRCDVAIVADDIAALRELRATMTLSGAIVFDAVLSVGNGSDFSST